MPGRLSRQRRASVEAAKSGQPSALGPSPSAATSARARLIATVSGWSGRRTRSRMARARSNRGLAAILPPVTAVPIGFTLAQPTCR
jgi:hypothetical protein